MSKTEVFPDLSLTDEQRTPSFVPLGDIAEVKLGKMLDRSKHKSGRSLPYLRNINVRWGSIDTSDLLEMFFKDEQEEQKFSLQKGDVLVCEGGEPGRAAVFNLESSELKYQKALHRVRFHNPYEPKLLVYFLEWAASRGELENRFTGSTIKHFTRQAFVQLPVPNPPLPEQRRIVARIEEVFSRLDAGVAALRHAKAQLQRYRQSVLAAAVTGQLTQAWREQNPDTEPASQAVAAMLKEREEKWEKKGTYSEPATPPDDLEPLPENWCWATWDQLSHWVTYGFTRPMAHVEEGIPIVTAKHVKGSRINYDDGHRTPQDSYEALSEKDRPKPGDILVTKDGTIGRAAVVESDRPFCINQSVAVVWLRTCPMYRKYLLTTIETESAQRQMTGKARGVAIKHLSITDFAKMSVPLPPLAEQHQIVAEVEARTTAIDHLEAELDHQLTRATRLRQSTLYSAFTGLL